MLLPLMHIRSNRAVLQTACRKMQTVYIYVLVFVVISRMKQEKI